MGETKQHLTFEQMHEISAPYCIRGDKKYVSLTYIPRYNQKYVDALVHMNGWSKEIPGVIWLN